MMKIFIFNLFVFFCSINTYGQVFIPFGFWRPNENCSATYCPTLNILTAPLIGTTGSTQIVNSCTDDGSILFTLPFDFYIAGTAYKNWYVGSNSYITAGTGSTVYNNLSSNNPNISKLMLGAGDSNYKNVYTKSALNYFRIRFEGNSSYGTCNTQNIIFEVTFFRPTINFQYIQVVFGSHGDPSRLFGIADSTTYYQTSTPITTNSSYVFYSSSGGTSWTILPAYSITGIGTNL